MGRFKRSSAPLSLPYSACLWGRSGISNTRLVCKWLLLMQGRARFSHCVCCEQVDTTLPNSFLGDIVPSWRSVCELVLLTCSWMIYLGINSDVTLFPDDTQNGLWRKWIVRNCKGISSNWRRLNENENKEINIGGGGGFHIHADEIWVDCDDPKKDLSSILDDLVSQWAISGGKGRFHVGHYCKKKMKNRTGDI